MDDDQLDMIADAYDGLAASIETYARETSVLTLDVSWVIDFVSSMAQTMRSAKEADRVR